MKIKPFSAVFDGSVPRPVEPVDQEPNTTDEITIVAKAPSRVEETAKVRETVWDVLDRLSGSAEGPGDFSAEHDHDLHGTPKRGSVEGQ